MRQRFKARPVASGVAQLPDSCQADFASKMPANHRQACRSAIGFVNLLDERNPPDPFLALPKESSLVSKRVLVIDFGRGFRFRFRLIEINFIRCARLGW